MAGRVKRVLSGAGTGRYPHIPAPLPSLQGRHEVRAGFFIFGDSLSDSGNNNDLQTFAKANFLPYGIDFPGGPTGRFTNGRTIVDLIGDLLGLDGYIPPFLAATGPNIVKGVNYASGAAGIRSDTGIQVGMRISMDQQLTNHKTIVSKVAKMLGNHSTTHLKNCMYSVYIGTNDWIMNYYGGGPIKLQLTPEAYADALITQLSQQLTALHNMGARKVIVFGLGPLGCIPSILKQGRCANDINAALEMYNTKLKFLVATLNTKLKHAKFIWINTMSILSPTNLQGLGLNVTNVACCGELQVSACVPLSIPCNDRGDHEFFDGVHPTEAVNKVLASRAFNAKEPTDAYPKDIRHLAKLPKEIKRKHKKHINGQKNIN